jgi:hypothetical protein
MASISSVVAKVMERPSPYSREVLKEQLLWFVRLRWIAAGSIVIAAAAWNLPEHRFYSLPELIETVKKNRGKRHPDKRQVF